MIRSSQIVQPDQLAFAASRESEEVKSSGDIEGLDVQEVGAHMISLRDHLKRTQKMEEKVLDHDKMLKEKDRTIERLEKRCEVLTTSMEEAHTKALAWEFEVHYGRTYNEAEALSTPVNCECKATKGKTAVQKCEESKELHLHQEEDFHTDFLTGKNHRKALLLKMYNLDF